MRRVLILVLVGALLATSVNARRPKDRAGKVDGGVYIDKAYNFKLTLDEGWKHKVSENKRKYRLVLTQINYEIPGHYLDAEDYTKIPRTVVYVDTTNMSVAALIDSLISDSYKSDIKKSILKEFEILNESSGGSGLKREKLVPRERKRLDVAGERGFMWTGKAKYRNEISTTASAVAAKRVYGGYAGGIVGVKKGDMVVLFHTICEENYFESVFSETLRLAKSLEWVE